MDAGPQLSRQPDIPGHDQYQAPGSADPGQVPPEGGSPRIAVVAQHHASAAAGQGGDRRPRVRQSPIVGEQPKPRQATGLRAQPPGEKFQVHGAAVPNDFSGGSLYDFR
jgi:hypothetical protein